MMNWAIALVLCLGSCWLSQWCALMVMWWCGWWRDFGDFHQSQFKTQFWWCSQSGLTKPNQSGSGLINHGQAWSIGIGPIKPDWARLGAWFWQCSQFWWWPLVIRELIFPQKMLKMPECNSLWSVAGTLHKAWQQGTMSAKAGRCRVDQQWCCGSQSIIVTPRCTQFFAVHCHSKHFHVWLVVVKVTLLSSVLDNDAFQSSRQLGEEKALNIYQWHRLQGHLQSKNLEHKIPE
jgi:hypothetical protein